MSVFGATNCIYILHRLYYGPLTYFAASDCVEFGPKNVECLCVRLRCGYAHNWVVHLLPKDIVMGWPLVLWLPPSPRPPHSSQRQPYPSSLSYILALPLYPSPPALSSRSTILCHSFPVTQSNPIPESPPSSPPPSSGTELTFPICTPEHFRQEHLRIVGISHAS